MNKGTIVANLQKLEDNIKNVSEFNRNLICKIFNDNDKTYCMLYDRKEEILIPLNVVEFKNNLDDKFIILLYSKISLNKKKKESYINSLNSIKFDYINLFFYYSKLTFLMSSKFDDTEENDINGFINFDVLVNPVSINTSLITYLKNFYIMKYSFHLNDRLLIEDMVMNGIERAYTRIHTYNPTKLPDVVSEEVPYLRFSKDKNVLKFFSWVITVVENSFKSELDNGYKTSKFNNVSLDFENEDGEITQNTLAYEVSFENFTNSFNVLASKLDNKIILEKIELLKYSNILPKALRTLFKGIYNAVYLTGTEAKENPTKGYNDIKYTIMKENNWSDDEYRRNLFNLQKKLTQLGYI